MSATLGAGGDLERLTGRRGNAPPNPGRGWDRQRIGRRFFIFPERAKADPENWFSFMLRASETGLIAQEKLAPSHPNHSGRYDQEFECSFDAVLYNYFKQEWLLPVDNLPPRDSLRVYGGVRLRRHVRRRRLYVHAVLGLDADGNPWLLDLWRKQASSDEWVASFCDLVRKWRPMAWAEETGQIKSGVGPWLEREMRERQAYTAREQFPTRGDKAIRAQSFGALSLRAACAFRRARRGDRTSRRSFCASRPAFMTTRSTPAASSVSFSTRCSMGRSGWRRKRRRSTTIASGQVITIASSTL